MFSFVCANKIGRQTKIVILNNLLLDLSFETRSFFLLKIKTNSFGKSLAALFFPKTNT